MSRFAGITACLVTRGDVDLRVLQGTIPFHDTVVWNNMERDDCACYGRFAAVEEAWTDWIYTQDDDLICPVPALVEAWHRAGNPLIFANRPNGEPWRFLGCGAIYHRSLLPILTRYADRYGWDHNFYRVADVAFTYQTPYTSVDLGYLDFPWQTAPNRMYHQPDHILVRQQTVDRIAEQGWLIPEKAVCPDATAA